MSTRQEPTAPALAWFSERCQAAEELDVLGHLTESDLLWRSALEQLIATFDERQPALSNEARRLLSEQPGAAREAWLTRVRPLVLRVEALSGPKPQTLLMKLTGAVLVLLACAVFVSRAFENVVSVSASYAPERGAEQAVDGDPASDWLLPDRTGGFLELALPRRRAVHGATVLNGHNLHYMDRAIQLARVEVFDDDRLVDSAELRFDKLEATPRQRTVQLAGKQATRVRLQVIEYFVNGAALAEFRVH